MDYRLTDEETILARCTPEEAATLTELARDFAPMALGLNPGQLLHDSVDFLINGLLETGAYGDIEDVDCRLHPLLAMAFDATNFLDDVVPTWRAFAALPESERESVLAAWQRSRSGK